MGEAVSQLKHPRVFSRAGALSPCPGKSSGCTETELCFSLVFYPPFSCQSLRINPSPTASGSESRLQLGTGDRGPNPTLSAGPHPWWLHFLAHMNWEMLLHSPGRSQQSGLGSRGLCPFSCLGAIQRRGGASGYRECPPPPPFPTCRGRRWPG